MEISVFLLFFLFGKRKGQDLLAPPLNLPLVNVKVLLRHSDVINSMKLVIPLHSLYWSIHTKDEGKRASAFAFIFGVN